ncbi:MAG: hypothetical protein NC079_01630 [Clostridium sp.]|nr:hypothetical protein [Acetatifactor muris]MCM1526585.1 hypothetical protein [Bacteroides sp.]MCM1562289.1 hypothetical protein [Clostridium sp.]
MYYVLDICPKCMDKLYERERPMKDEEYAPVSEASCPNCGHRLIEACVGETKPDSTVYDTTYKIFIRYTPDSHEKEATDIVMKLGHCSRDAALEKLGTKNSFLCEGNLLETYLNKRELQKVNWFLGYKTEPEFPYDIPAFFFFCPTCEGIPVEKTEVLEDGSYEVETGIFCEKCNKWVDSFYTTLKDVDNTIYHLKASLQGVESNVKKKLLEELEEYEDWEIRKEVTEEGFTVDGRATGISGILIELKSNGIGFEIAPVYPYEIPVYKKLWTEADVELLKAMNPGFNVTAEELNALN